MDNSETNVKMCEKLPDDFPGKYCLSFGDYYYDKEKREECIHFESAFCLVKDSRIVKLYRQDQLQEMCGNVGDLPFTILEVFYEYAKALVWDENPSYEQLWLMLLMKEENNKVWNGEEWA